MFQRATNQVGACVCVYVFAVCDETDDEADWQRESRWKRWNGETRGGERLKSSSNRERVVASKRANDDVLGVHSVPSRRRCTKHALLLAFGVVDTHTHTHMYDMRRQGSRVCGHLQLTSETPQHPRHLLHIAHLLMYGVLCDVQNAGTSYIWRYIVYGHRDHRFPVIYFMFPNHFPYVQSVHAANSTKTKKKISFFKMKMGKNDVKSLIRAEAWI